MSRLVRADTSVLHCVCLDSLVFFIDVYAACIRWGIRGQAFDNNQVFPDVFHSSGDCRLWCMQALSRAYVDRGSAFVTAELSRLTDAPLARASLGQNDRSRAGAWSPPDPTLVQAQCDLLAPLLQVCCTLSCAPLITQRLLSISSPLSRAWLGQNGCNSCAWAWSLLDPILVQA